MKLLWYETEQLTDHLKSRPDIWSSPRSGMWLRTRCYDDDTALCGLAVQGPIPETGPFRQFVLRTVPMAWNAEQCDQYLENLCIKWTDYGTRRRFAAFLTAEAGLDSRKAAAAAIGLCTLEQGIDIRSSADPEPSTGQLFGSAVEPPLDPHGDARLVRSYAIVGGGWINLRLAGGMLRIRASLRTSAEYGGGFSGDLEGFVRPAQNRSVENEASRLFGIPHPFVADDSEPTFSQAELTDGTAEQWQREFRRSAAVSADVQVEPSGVGADAQTGVQTDLPQPEPGSTV